MDSFQPGPEMKNPLMSRIGTALVDWTNYIIDVNRFKILNESSIKYAVSELLEVLRLKTASEKGSQNPPIFGEVPFIYDYTFEYLHPIYKNRDFDLHISTSNEEYIYTAMEFKFLADNSLSDSALKLYIYDLLRLYALTKDNNLRVSPYFLIIGEMSNYKEVFGIDKNSQALNMPPEVGHGVKEEGQSSENIPYSATLFTKVLPQDLQDVKETKLSELKNSENVSMLDSFNGDYKLREGKEALKGSDKMKIELEFSNLGGHDYRTDKSMAVQIWHIYN